MLKQLSKILSDNSPALLSGVAIAGLVSTTILAVKATPQAMREIEWVNENHHRPLTKREQVSVAWRRYIPSLVMGSVTIVCIVGATTIASRRQAALVGLYSLSETAFREYRDKVAETYGGRKDLEVQESVDSDTIRKTYSESDVIFTGKGDHLCFDTFSGRYFRSDYDKIRKAMNDLNAMVINHSYASQNDFYRLIGLENIAIGDEVGWRPENLLDLGFTSHLTEDGVPCIALRYNHEPIRNYYKGHL